MSSTDATALAALTISPDATILEALRALDRGAMGILFVADESERVIGTLTDGDLRRALIAGAALEARCIRSAMQPAFKHVHVTLGRAEVLDAMRAWGVQHVPVIDDEGRLCGLHTVRELISTVHRPNAALILAGGKGTRLQPLTANLPKPMMRVAGRPILERLILHVISHGIREVYLSVNYLAHTIEEHFRDGEDFGCRIQYLREESPLGTGGPLSFLPRPCTHPVVVLNGDLITQCDIGRLIQEHVEGKHALTMGVHPYAITVPFGVVSVQHGRVTDVQEKPTQSTLVNAGIYVVSDEAIGLVPRGQYFPMTELYHRCRTHDLPVGAHVIEDDWIDVGRHDDLRKARGES